MLVNNGVQEYTIHNSSIQTGTNMKTLTEKQQIVLEFLRDYSSEHGFPPSMREIGLGIGVANVSAVRGHLAALEKKGYISKDTDKARSIRVLHLPSAFSRFKKKLHEIVSTDKGVYHRVVYAIAVATRGRSEIFSGKAGEAMVLELDKRAVEHGWDVLDRKVEADHVTLIVEVWPNHSPELVARRIKTAGDSVAKRFMQQKRGKTKAKTKTATKSLWADGYAITTEIDRLDELLQMLLEGTKTSVRE
ncbi:MAG TPA: hypothetical protein ENL03_03110 [Phycisphaerae bacterium]|nr:hypothetical protein [Phycisphaerae bacterium]